MAVSRRWFAVAVLISLASSATVARAQVAKPGEAVEYTPFFPDKWKQFGQPTTMYPWEGKRVVLMTTTTDLDGKTMAVFLDRLDAGWALYERLMGRTPTPFRQHNGKPTIAAVPASKFTCGMGCGYIGSSGVEVAGFYKDFFGGPGDYELVRKDPELFFHYYFYEMGRNYFLFGDRHSAFTTGFAVFMRYVCMDALRCKDHAPETRETVDRAEALYAESGLTYAEAFIESKGLKDGSGKPVNPTDANVMYASVMLKLRRDYGGDEWVKRFYGFISQCPPLPPQTKDDRLGHALYWVIAASAAAAKDLTPLFETRWRFPLRPEMWPALRAVDWGKKGLTVAEVLDALPVEHLPQAVAVRRPAFLTPERRKANLIAGGTFEKGAEGKWTVQADAASPTDEVAKEGSRSLAIRSFKGRDSTYRQKVKVTPNTRYLLSGWVKTKGVEVVQKGGTVGANLSLYDGWDRTETITGDADWTYLVLVFDSGKRTEVEVCARVGHFGSTAKGEAWFDDLVLVEIGKSPAPK